MWGVLTLPVFLLLGTFLAINTLQRVIQVCCMIHLRLQAGYFIFRKCVLELSQQTNTAWWEILHLLEEDGPLGKKIPEEQKE